MGVTYIVYRVKFTRQEYRPLEGETEEAEFSFNPHLWTPNDPYEYFAKRLDVDPIQIRDIDESWGGFENN